MSHHGKAAFPWLYIHTNIYIYIYIYAAKYVLIQKLAMRACTAGSEGDVRGIFTQMEASWWAVWILLGSFH